MCMVLVLCVGGVVVVVMFVGFVNLFWGIFCSNGTCVFLFGCQSRWGVFVVFEFGFVMRTCGGGGVCAFGRF